MPLYYIPLVNYYLYCWLPCWCLTHLVLLFLCSCAGLLPRWFIYHYDSQVHCALPLYCQCPLDMQRYPLPAPWLWFNYVVRLPCDYMPFLLLCHCGVPIVITVPCPDCYPLIYLTTRCYLAFIYPDVTYCLRLRTSYYYIIMIVTIVYWLITLITRDIIDLYWRYHLIVACHTGDCSVPHYHTLPVHWNYPCPVVGLQLLLPVVRFCIPLYVPIPTLRWRLRLPYRLPHCSVRRRIATFCPHCTVPIRSDADVVPSHYWCLPLLLYYCWEAVVIPIPIVIDCYWDCYLLLYTLFQWWLQCCYCVDVTLHLIVVITLRVLLITVTLLPACLTLPWYNHTLQIAIDAVVIDLLPCRYCCALRSIDCWLRWIICRYCCYYLPCIVVLVPCRYIIALSATLRDALPIRVRWLFIYYYWFVYFYLVLLLRYCSHFVVVVVELQVYSIAHCLVIYFVIVITLLCSCRWLPHSCYPLLLYCSCCGSLPFIAVVIIAIVTRLLHLLPYLAIVPHLLLLGVTDVTAFTCCSLWFIAVRYVTGATNALPRYIYCRCDCRCCSLCDEPTLPFITFIHWLLILDHFTLPWLLLLLPFNSCDLLTRFAVVIPTFNTPCWYLAHYLVYPCELLPLCRVLPWLCRLYLLLPAFYLVIPVHLRCDCLCCWLFDCLVLF